jgi:plastocyanin
MTHRRIGIAVLTLCFSVAGLRAQTATVRARVEVEGAGKSSHASLPTTVVWLTPAPGDPKVQMLPSGPPPRLTQRNKSFEPHVLVVPAGSAVEFPNRDPFFHNVFSLFEGKRFDLGLYEAGSSRVVHFDRAGISYIFCNIHPEMSGVVITLTTPFYALVHGQGSVEIPNVPYGRYEFHVWNEGTGPESTPPAPREITISESATSLGVIRVPALSGQTVAHKNKYGRDYDAPTPDSPVYHQQP